MEEGRKHISKCVSAITGIYMKLNEFFGKTKITKGLSDSEICKMPSETLSDVPQ